VSTNRRHNRVAAATGGVESPSSLARPDEHDAYLPLKDLAAYSGLSVRTLRNYLSRASRPLPSYRVGGKVLVRRSEFNDWMRMFRRLDGDRVDTIVAEIAKGL
jgi:excisionase family DNA binding protein